MSTRTPKCKAQGGAAVCTDPNCPEKRAAFNAFIAEFNGQKQGMPRVKKFTLPRIRGGKLTVAPEKPSFPAVRGAFENLVHNYELGDVQERENDDKLKEAYATALEGLRVIDELDELGATTGKDTDLSEKTSLRDARQALQRDLDYWDNRIFNGDPLFDQWMVDARERDQEGLRLLDRLENLGADTGAADIKPNVRTHYDKIEIKDVRESLYEKGEWRFQYVIDDNMHVYGENLKAASIEEARIRIEAQVRAQYKDKISPEKTAFKHS